MKHPRCYEVRHLTEAGSFLGRVYARTITAAQKQAHRMFGPCALVVRCK